MDLAVTPAAQGNYVSEVRFVRHLILVVVILDVVGRATNGT